MYLLDVHNNFFCVQCCSSVAYETISSKGSCGLKSSFAKASPQPAEPLTGSTALVQSQVLLSLSMPW